MTQAEKRALAEAKKRIARAYGDVKPSNEGISTGLSFTFALSPQQESALRRKRQELELRLAEPLSQTVEPS